MIPDVVVDTVGYLWQGSEAGKGRFSYGEQVQLSGGISLTGGVAAIVSLVMVMIG